MSDDVGRDREAALKMMDGLHRPTVGAHIAMTLADEDVATTNQTNNALEVAAAGQDRQDRFMGKGDRQWYVAPRTAQEERDPVDASGDRVVTADLNRTIVSQKEIRNAAQSVHGIAILEGDWLVPAIPTRHDQREVDASEEQMLERRVGQHQTEMTQSRSHLIGHPLTYPEGAPRHEDDGTGR